MFFYSPVEAYKNNFDEKVQGFINYSAEDGFSIVLTEKQVLEFQQKYPNLKLTSVSDTYIVGSNASLYVFKK